MEGKGGKRGSITTDSVTLDLFRQFLQHVDFPLARLATLEPFHDLLRPLASFPAGGALAATLVLVKRRQSRYRAHDIGAFIHHDYGRRPQTGLAVFESVEIHQLFVACIFGEDGRGGAAGDDGFEVVPPAAHAAGVLFDQFFEGDGHFFFDGAGVVDVSRDAE